METISIPSDEAAEYEEYKRRKKMTELRGKLRGLEPTLLRKNATLREIRALCEQAKRLSSVCVCVQPVYVKTCRTYLKNSGVGVSAFVGGNSESAVRTKLCEAKSALRDGASEIDFSPSVSAISNGNYGYLKREVRRVRSKAKGKTVKFFLDAYSVPQDKFLRAAQTIVDGGANYLCVRAEEELVTLLQREIRKPCKLKVFGVETPELFRTMLSLGCSRVGSELAEDLVHAMENEVNGARASVQAED